MKSATVNVRGDDFFTENLTFANDFNATHPQLPQGSQALALLVTGDRAVFRNVRFLRYLPFVKASGATGKWTIAPASTSSVILLNNSIGPDSYLAGGT